MVNHVCLPQLKSGDILVWNDSFKGQSRYGALIRLFTASDFTHVGVAIKNDDGLFSAEANVPVIRTTKVDLSDRLFYIPTPIIHDNIGQSFIDDTQGLRYSYLDAIRSLFGIIDERNDKWQCAEYVLDYLKCYGHDLGRVYTPSRLVRAAMREFNAPLVPLYTLPDYNT